MAATTPAPLSADLEHGLRRLKLASMRRVAPGRPVSSACRVGPHRAVVWNRVNFTPAVGCHWSRSRPEIVTGPVCPG